MSLSKLWEVVMNKEAGMLQSMGLQSWTWWSDWTEPIAALFFLCRYVYSYLFCSFYCNDKWIDSLIYLSDISLLMLRNASDFCVLILYLYTLLNSLINASNFLVISLGFYMYSVMSANSFASSFSIWIPFISFSLLIAIASTTKIMLNKWWEWVLSCPLKLKRGNPEDWKRECWKRECFQFLTTENIAMALSCAMVCWVN